MKQSVEEAAKEYANGLYELSDRGILYRETQSDFIAGAKWQLEQNPWRNFKDERPKPNSHILRKMTYPNYQVYGKTIYYADFWGEDRPDKWEQENDRAVYE